MNPSSNYEPLLENDLEQQRDTQVVVPSNGTVNRETELRNAQIENERYRTTCCGIGLNFNTFRAKNFAITAKSFIFFISVVQTILFIITQRYEPVYKPEEFPCIFYKLGAKYTPSILTFHHFHRLVLPILLHLNLAHIGGNFLLQLLVGFRLEKGIGHMPMIIFYCLAGIGGNLLSAITMPNNISLGASSSILGLLGLSCCYIVKHWRNIQLDNIDRGIGLFAVYNVYYTFTHMAPGVDNAAHLGGFIVGFFLGVVLMQRSEETKKIEFNWKTIISLVALIGYFVTLSIILFRMPNQQAEAEKAADECYKKYPWF